MIVHYLSQTSVLLALIVGYVLPLVTAFIYRQHWSVTVMGPITAVLSAITGFISEWADNPDSYSWRDGLVRGIFVALAAAVGYFQSWHNTPLEGDLRAVGSRRG